MNWLRKNKELVRSLIIGSIVFGVVLFLGTGVYLYRKKEATEAIIAMRYQESLESAETQTAASEEPQTVASEELPAEVDLSLDTVSWKEKTYMRNQYVKAILCMGVDRNDTMTEKKELGSAGQADGIFLIAQDVARNKLKILMIPRDTITEITKRNPDGSLKGKELDHLSLAFAYGDGREESCLYLKEAVEDLFHGFPIDYYLAADTAIVSILNDAVGGVTVTVPTVGMEKIDPSFVQGTQVTLKGKQAEAFVRFRDISVDNSALFRMNQQKEYITQYFLALQKASRTDSRIVSNLFELAQNHMVTDLSKDQYMKIALDAVSSEGIRGTDFYFIPGTGVTTDVYDQYHVDDEGMTEVLLNLFYRKES